MYDKGTDAALEFFDKGLTFKLTTHDLSMSEVNTENLKKELDLPEDKSITLGLVNKIVMKQSIIDLAKKLNIEEESSQLMAFASRYLSVVQVMVNGRIKLDDHDFNVDSSFFQTLNTKKKLCFLEHCKANAAKVLEATGRAIENMKNNNLQI